MSCRIGRSRSSGGSAGAGFRGAHRRSRAWPAQPVDRRGPRQNRPLRHQCRRCRSGCAGGRGRTAATQVIQGEKLFDLVVRMKPEFRENAQQIGNLLVGTPAGQQIPLSALSNIHEASGASFIYRENNSRYIGVQYSIEGRDLESAVAPASMPLPTSKNPFRPAIGSTGAESTANFSKHGTRWKSSALWPCSSFS